MSKKTNRALAILLVSAAGPALATAPVPIRFACTTSGEKLIAPAVSAIAVCERFRTTLSSAARLALRADPGRFTAEDRAPWIRVTLRFTKAGVASARLERSERGRVTVHPDSSIAVSDRAIGLQTVDLMARNAARAIDAGDKAR